MNEKINEKSMQEGIRDRMAEKNESVCEKW